MSRCSAADGPAQRGAYAVDPRRLALLSLRASRFGDLRWVLLRAFGQPADHQQAEHDHGETDELALGDVDGRVGRHVEFSQSSSKRSRRLPGLSV